MSIPLIPFNRPYRSQNELEHVLAALDSGHLHGDGDFTARSTAELSKLLGDARCLLTTSCTHALEMTALLLDLEPGDEVIVPSFTFVSTANAYTLHGAVPVFVDCRPDTFNMDESLVEQAITERTRAIVVVHYGGVACEMDEIMAIAGRYGLMVIEDNAHGLGASYGGRPLGSIGSMATQSFHSTKNVQCGEGGALVLNDHAFIERAEMIREKGTNRARFFRGAIDKYTWVDTGSSYLPSDVLAALLLGQLEDFVEIQTRRHAIWSAYDSALPAWVAAHGVQRQSVPPGCEHAAHLFALLMPEPVDQGGLIEHLRTAGVAAAFHYQPLHVAPYATRRTRVSDGGCPVTEDVAARLVRLPLHATMTDADVERVIDATISFKPAG